MIRDSLQNGVLLTNIWYCTAHIEKVYKYHKITERVLILCHKLTVSKLRDTRYGVAVTVIVPEGKAVIPSTRVWYKNT